MIALYIIIGILLVIFFIKIKVKVVITYANCKLSIAITISTLKIKICNININKNIEEVLASVYMWNKNNKNKNMDVRGLSKIVFSYLNKMNTNTQICLRSNKILLNAYVGTLISTILSICCINNNNKVYKVHTMYGKTYIWVKMLYDVKIINILIMFFKILKEGIYGKTSN